MKIDVLHNRSLLTHREPFFDFFHSKADFAKNL